MFNRFGAGLAIMAAAGMLLVVACSDDEETTTPTTTTQPQGGSGGTGTGGAGGSTGMTCEEACAVAYDCGQAECPDWEADDPTEDGWLNGSDGGGAPVSGCLENCQGMPALIGLVEAYQSDCASMVGALATANPAFDESCNGAGTGGSGGAAGGAGGAAEGGAGGATGGAGGA